jgi:DMSO/TMAO reductase YedYZ molybdopterin-dependent catalytic subunit
MRLRRQVVGEDPFNASTPIEALREELTPVALHYVRNHFDVPCVEEPEKWVLRVGGAVESPFAIALSELQRLPHKSLAITLECAGNGRTRMQPLPPGTPWDDGAVSTQRWTGVALRDVLDRARVREEAIEVLMRGADRGHVEGKELHFERALPLADALHPDTILAWQVDGQALPAEHGRPLRAVIPGWYGVASVKWLCELTLLAEPFAGYFQKERYTYEGWPGGAPLARVRVKSAVAWPTQGSNVRAGEPLLVEGRAWCGTVPVSRVEVSMDGGKSWHGARLDAASSPHAWRRFSIEWRPAAGEHAILSRATAEDGSTQPMFVEANRHGYGFNGCVPVKVTAS